MKLNELYRNLTTKSNSPESFIANIIYTGYRANRKKMLQGLYNIINGGPRHYWVKCHVTFAPFQMETILATPLEGQDRIKEIDINNLVFYA
tara:strand:+ start:110 stop:382 length:273 start_codon:yes stop_codon:yes gene_type:complete